MTVVFHGGRGYHFVTRLVGDVAGVRHAGNVAIGRMRLPDDAIGVFTLTLNNLIVGSAIQIEPQAGGAALHSSVAGGTSAVVSLQAYAPGSPNNSLRIKVRKGTAAPYYQPFETQATAVVGSQAIFVSQIPDE